MDTISKLIEETINAFKERDDPRFKREIEMLERMKEKLKKGPVCLSKSGNKEENHQFSKKASNLSRPSMMFSTELA
jgi:hypothetical protein